MQLVPTSQQKKTGRELRRQRRRARQQRRERRAAKNVDVPARIELPPNNDPLLIYDRNKEPIGHVLRNLWAPSAGFLVCGGPSLKTIDVELLRQRGVVSLGINNAAAYAPVTAMTFSDPPKKFHYGIFLDPKILKLVPHAKKLKGRIRAKLPDGSFRMTSYEARDCPNTFGFSRGAEFDPGTFFTSPAATWGNNKKAADQNGRPHILFTFFIGLRLMHYLGCRRVYLLGVDFSMSQGKCYAFMPDRHDGAIRGNTNSYKIAAHMLRQLQPHFEQHQFECYNCNPNSHLEVFDFVPFDTALEDCRGLVPEEPFDCGNYYDK